QYPDHFNGTPTPTSAPSGNLTAPPPLQRTGFTTSQSAQSPAAPIQQLGAALSDGRAQLQPLGSAARSRAMAAGMATGGLFPVSPTNSLSTAGTPQPNSAAPQSTRGLQGHTGSQQPAASFGFPQTPNVGGTPSSATAVPFPVQQHGISNSTRMTNPGFIGGVTTPSQSPIGNSGGNTSAYNDSLREFQNEIRRQNSGLGSPVPQAGSANSGTARPAQAQYPSVPTGIRPQR
ncbi:MAG: hypothetical protein ABGZ17_03940, partial [Planctomycetaceae bacterium]